MKMSEDTTSLRWCKLNRNSLKNFLSDRYGRKIAERMTNFIEGNIGTLFKIDFE